MSPRDPHAAVRPTSARSLARWAATALVLLFGAACSHEAPEEEEGASSPSEEQAAPLAEASCERWVPVQIESEASFRGLSAVSENEVWISGTGGTVGRSVDGGASWSFMTVPGAQELDFRDIDAFPGGVAYAMSAGPGEASQIHKTDDGGANWTRQFLMPHGEGFLDGMAFWNESSGLAYGDPVGGAFFVLQTRDGGATWTRVPAESMPPSIEGEAGFAASGSGLAVRGDGLAIFGTGGAAARIFRSSDYGETWTVHETPLASGEPSKGIFSVALLDENGAVAVGGDYQGPETASENAAFSTDGGVSWSLASELPAGYRSAVVRAPAGLLAAGTSGADLSTDGGVSWTASWTPPESADADAAVALNVLAAADGPCAVWGAGPDGVILRWVEAATP